MSDVILHLGFHKTATGTLQRQFFPACQDLQLLTTLVPEMKTFMELVTRKDPLYFDPQLARSVLDPVMSSSKPNLLSNESFSGPPYAGLIEAGLDHRSPVLANLKAVFPNAKAILVLRRQDALSKSLYRQYLKVGGTRNIRRFYGLESSPRSPLMSLDRFYFYPYVKAVEEAFPKGTLVLAFEEFVKDPTGFLRKVTDFIGVRMPKIELKRENATTLGPLGMEISRYLNHLFRGFTNPGTIIPGFPKVENGRVNWISPVSILHDHWWGRGARVQRGMVHDVGLEILNIVRDDNKILSDKYSLNLDKYGYY